jgi:hypothetical protein
MCFRCDLLESKDLITGPQLTTTTERTCTARSHDLAAQPNAVGHQTGNYERAA